MLFGTVNGTCDDSEGLLMFPICSNLVYFVGAGKDAQGQGGPAPSPLPQTLPHHAFFKENII